MAGTDGAVPAAAGVAAGGTIFGTQEFRNLVAQLNTWAPQLEQTARELRGSQIVLEAQLQRSAEGGANELMKIIAAVRSEPGSTTCSDKSSGVWCRKSTRSSSRWKR